ncbi:MAG: iron chelate uptake ABC transporter family permease subunit [Cardiobacteriaceae bacterium]|nr:iron chelate uptake ABC transporter family permease subunit [Cardiobacteriaceae bacterium]
MNKAWSCKALWEQPLTRRMMWLLLALCLSALGYMLIKASGSWSFLLTHRGEKLWNLLLVGAAVGMSTVMFQTISHNRILTPSLIGLDALYLLIQMGFIFFFSTTAYSELSPLTRFLGNTALMMAMAVILFGLARPLLQHDLYRLLLIGVIFGVLCRNLNQLMGRLLDPTEYAFYQGIAYAQFNRAQSALLLPSTFLILANLVYVWKKRFVLDVLSLGRVQAIGLGVNYAKEVFVLMLLTASLVAISTALVGPILFFGLLVSALTYQLFPTPRHSILLPVSAMMAGLMLVLGQTIFERFWGLAGSLSMVIEGLGGLLFLLSLTPFLRKRA